MASARDVHDLAEALLAAAVASIGDGSDTNGGAPERQFVAYGLPVDDFCEQLVVWVNPITERATRVPAGARVKIGAWLNEVVFSVQIGRCVPVAETKGKSIALPTLAEISAAALIHNTDGWALWNGLHARAADVFGGCKEVVFGPLQARQPSGGCAGWIGSITVQVDGYTPEPGS